MPGSLALKLWFAVNLLGSTLAVSLPGCQEAAPSQKVLADVRTATVNVPGTPWGIAYAVQKDRAFITLTGLSADGSTQFGNGTLGSASGTCSCSELGVSFRSDAGACSCSITGARSCSEYKGSLPLQMSMYSRRYSRNLHENSNASTSSADRRALRAGENGRQLGF
jgi:hypothetical protein